MGVVISENSDLGKELKRWNTPRNQFVVIDGETTNVRGMGAIGYEPYPKMLYKAQRTRGGQWKCMMPIPQAFEFETLDRFQQATLYADSFNTSCQFVVKDEQDHAKARREGWRDSAKDAEAFHEGLEQDIAAAAAEANFGVARMSEQARREFAAAGASTEHHVVDVKPKRKYTKKSKATPVAVTGAGEVDSEA